MGKFKKIFNYYLSSYWNNSRTLSSMYSFLKIFFERNNKIDSTVSSFGNVFRNSKWSNMQVQNIKKLFIKQWLWFFLVILLTSFYLITYTGVTLNASYLSFFYIKQTLNEFITNFYYLVGCIIYQLYLFTTTLFLNNQRVTSTLNTESRGDLSSPQGLHVNTLSANTTNVNSNLFFLQKSLLAINNLNGTANVFLPKLNITSNLNVNEGFFNKISFISTLPNSNSNNFTGTSINTETSYVLSTKLDSSFSNSLTLSTTLGNLYSNEDSFQNDPVLTETLTHSLNNVAKQQRWLTRNFWSNQNFVSDSNKLTQSKNFIQNPLLSNSGTDSNIWLSNKLSGLETEKTSDVFNKLLPNYNLLSVFNFFDTSRFFLNQRYSYLNQLTNQFITSSVDIKSSQQPINTAETSSLKLTLLQSYFIRNIPFNTSLYSSNSKKFSTTSFDSSSSSTLLDKSVRNFFASTSFTDLLQHNDLQTLNTINASTNSVSKLHLNRNYCNVIFKS